MQTNRTEALQIKQRARATRTSLLILIAFISCYFPLMLPSIYQALGSNSVFLNTYIQITAEAIAVSNSMFDPLVYFWRLRAVRGAAKTLVCSCMEYEKAKKLSISDRERTISQTSSVSKTSVASRISNQTNMSSIDERSCTKHLDELFTVSSVARDNEGYTV